MSLYQEFKELIQRAADVEKSIAVLHWDQETYIPAEGGAVRARQIAMLSGIAHEMKTSPKLGDMMYKLNADTSLPFEQKRNVEEALRSYEHNLNYPASFVMEMSAASSRCFGSWSRARKQNDFSIFLPDLTNMLRLKREETAIWGYTDHPYDAMLDQYEPGAKTADITALFANVRDQLVGFVKEISQRGSIADEWMYGLYNRDTQWNFGLDVLDKMGFDMQRGRQDYSAHPFTISFSPEDVRLTTRVKEDNFHEMLWSSIHEGGHGLYEQGLNRDEYGMPNGEATSLAIHESQSRIWENNVGRALPFWKYFYPRLQALFPENLKEVSLDSFYKSMNVVRPSLIRTNADELTYHFHILVRFELEKALIEGSLEVADLPAAWNKKYEEYLDLKVPDDSSGCLQDVHWSHGSFGYFPTYSLGSFYAAQFYRQALNDIPGLETNFAHGDFRPFLDWLRKNIHVHGKMYTAEELCVRITGEKLNFRHFMDYATEKYSRIYTFAPAGLIA